MPYQQWFTTGEAAFRCGWSLSTFKRRLYRDQRNPRRTPGGDIRISRQQLREIMITHNIPLNEMEENSEIAIRVNDRHLENMLVRALQRNRTFKVIRTARDDLDFGYILATARPSNLIIDGSCPPLETLQRCRRIRQFLQPQKIRIGMLAETGQCPDDPAGPDILLSDYQQSIELDYFIKRLTLTADPEVHQVSAS